jgi:L-fuconolactonase
MEDILEPDLAICDPHHHLWHREDRHYTVEELMVDVTSGHRIEKTVFVDCHSGYRTEGPETFRVVGETEFVVDVEPTGFIAGIVGNANVSAPDIDDVLAAHVEAGKGRFKGIRNIAAWDPDPTIQWMASRPQILADPAFRSGFSALERADLTFETWLFHPQIVDFVDLAQSFPNVRMILDHLGGPLSHGRYAGHRDEVLAAWRPPMEALSRCPNVALKLGGIGQATVSLPEHVASGDVSSEEIAAAWGEPIRWCIELFGADRCMFESNFPPDSATCTYATMWNAFKRIAADASPSEKAALFYGTASSVYRI